MPAPESFFKIWELAEQTSRRRTLQNLHSIGNRNRWRDTQKQMDVIRLYLFRDNRPLALGANRVKNFPNDLRNSSDQHVVAILRAPNHMVSCLVTQLLLYVTLTILEKACSASPPFLSRLKSGVSWRTFYEKYEGANYERIGRILYDYSGDNLANLQEMVRRLLVNILLANGDAHLKNWSLVYPDRHRAELAPAYGVCQRRCRV